MELIEIIYSVVIFFTILFTTVFTFSYISYKLKQKGKNPTLSAESNIRTEVKNSATQKPVKKIEPVLKSSNSESLRTTNFHKTHNKIQHSKSNSSKPHQPERLRKQRLQRIVELSNKSNQKKTEAEISEKKKTVELPKQKIQKTNTLNGDLISKYMDDHNSEMVSIIKKTRID